MVQILRFSAISLSRDSSLDRSFDSPSTRVLRLICLGLANAMPRLPRLNGARVALLRLSGMTVGPQTIIWGPVTVTPYRGLSHITIGANAFINVDARFGCPDATIDIGEDVQIGPRVSFETVNHGLRYEPGRGRGATSHPIRVGNDAWLGSGVTVLAGVTIGEGAVVAAGAVVTKDVAANTLVGGVPARLIRRIVPNDTPVNRGPSHIGHLKIPTPEHQVE